MFIKKIAVIGTGLAGYTAAQKLSKASHSVTIFDKVLQGLTANPNVTLQFNIFIEQAIFAKLRTEYDVILLAPGAQVENTFGFKTGKGIIVSLL